ncbi:MAG: hypothetical protein AB8F78_00690 [Saprospiraceae bacterium]
MRIQLLLVSSLIFLSSACTPDKKTQTPPVVSSGSTVTAPAAAVQNSVPMNDVTRNLTEGLWLVDKLFERVPTPRYQAQQGRYYNFEANGDYALFNADGSIFHFGKWRYKPGESDRNYISLDATDPQYNNQWKILMSDADAVFVGTELYDNPGVQQRLEQLTSLPASAINAQKQ